MGNRNQKRRKGEPKVDEHHILYSHHEWNDVGRWGKLLRNHPYYKKIIPIKNLHHLIHAQVKFIPPPSNSVCKSIYNATLDALDQYEIDVDYDTVERRISFFIAQLTKYDDDQNYNDTICALMQQSEIVARYYSKSRPKSPLHEKPKPPFRDRYESFSILYPSKTWGVKGYGKVLSENSYFIVRIPKGLVDKIHKDVHVIQKPKSGACLKVINQQLEHARKAKTIDSRFDSLEKRIQFLLDAFSDWHEYDTCNDLEKVLTAISEYYHHTR